MAPFLQASDSQPGLSHSSAFLFCGLRNLMITVMLNLVRLLGQALTPRSLVKHQYRCCCEGPSGM